MNYIKKMKLVVVVGECNDGILTTGREFGVALAKSA